MVATASRLSEKCRKCPNVKKCDNKRIEACAFMEMPNNLSSNYIAPLTSTLSTQMTKPHTPVTIKMGKYENIDTSLEEIQKQIEQKICSALQVPSCILNGGK